MRRTDGESTGQQFSQEEEEIYHRTIINDEEKLLWETKLMTT